MNWKVAKIGDICWCLRTPISNLTTAFCTNCKRVNSNWLTPACNEFSLVTFLFWCHLALVPAVWRFWCPTAAAVQIRDLKLVHRPPSQHLNEQLEPRRSKQMTFRSDCRPATGSWTHRKLRVEQESTACLLYTVTYFLETKLLVHYG